MPQRGGRAFEEEAAAVPSALGAEVNDPVGLADDGGVMLGDNDAVSAVHKALQQREQQRHILFM